MIWKNKNKWLARTISGCRLVTLAAKNFSKKPHGDRSGGELPVLPGFSVISLFPSWQGTGPMMLDNHITRPSLTFFTEKARNTLVSCHKRDSLSFKNRGKIILLKFICNYQVFVPSEKQKTRIFFTKTSKN